jgi:hypothetical protein
MKVRTAQQTRAIESTCLLGHPDTNAMNADVGSTLRNCLITLLFLFEVLVASLDARDQVRMLPREIRVYVKLGFPEPI